MTATSTIEFLLLLMILASAIAVVAMRLRIPYTVALVIGGLALGAVHLHAMSNFFGESRPNWLTPDVILILFLPGLLFEGSARINIRQLRQNLVPVLILANVGVLITTVFIGYALHWALGLPLLVTLLFGAIISATDPISVLAIFKELSVGRRLSLLVEAESLVNDGTAVALFQVLIAGVLTSKLHVGAGVEEFFVSVLGGSAIGLGLGYLMSFITMQIDDPQIEITLTMILAYGSYVLANQLHVSGVLATVVAGITVGNVGARLGMSARTRIALWAFWDYFAFVINSIVFLLIGIEVRVGELLHRWPAILLAIGVVLAGRAAAVYGLVPLSNLFSGKIPLRWRHVLVWGGLHGSLSLALALSLAKGFPHRQDILAFTFGVVAFSLAVQGLTMKPLLRLLKISATPDEEHAATRVEHQAMKSALVELEQMLKARAISRPVFAVLRGELLGQHEKLKSQVDELHARDGAQVDIEIETARMRLSMAIRLSVNQAVREGEIRAEAGEKIIDSAERQLEKLVPEKDSDSNGLNGGK
ncbi:MAG: Na+/H+ antiporter [Candidatus Acidiferrales bacterium]